MAIRKVPGVIRRESIGPAADFNQRIRAGVIGAVLILFLFWVAT